MGLLKHAVLPLFAAIHVMGFMACFSLQGWAEMILLEEPITETDNASIRQLHMLGCIRGFNIAMLILCILGITTESAHFRGTVVLAETALHAMTMFDAYMNGLQQWIVPLGFTLGGIIALVVHSKEPGIFTSDKNNKKKE